MHDAQQARIGFDSLLEPLCQVFFTALQPVLADKASQVVFANIEDILMFNTVSYVPLAS